MNFKVYEVLLADGKKVAVKKIDLSLFSTSSAQNVYDEQKDEIVILKSLNHPNIVKYSNNFCF